MSEGISLIVGLGNPGSGYSETRHNAGFHFLDALLQKTADQLKPESRFGGSVAKVNLAGHPVWCLAPNEFMNHSGRAMSKFANFYKIESRSILVVHDELDLPPGSVRLKEGGGHGGHNGLRDIVDQMGTKDFMRLRIGIGHPGQASKVSGYVLKKAPEGERELTNLAINRGLDEIENIVQGRFQEVMNTLHTDAA